MFDALQVALIWIFKELKMHRVAAAYIPTNERSGALLRRLGFTVEGYARDYLFINGRWRDHILTSFIMNDVAGLSSERAATRRRTWEGRVARSAAEFAAMKRRDQESE
jgi:ribosomal-protein-alanine N-acetyltransferase